MPIGQVCNPCSMTASLVDMDAGRFRLHVRRTYFTLRLSMGLSALAFPVLLSLGGWLVIDLPYQPSLSDYYYTPMGDIFVGMLIAIGASLTVYAGYSRQEDWVLNLAGVLAVAVALQPADGRRPEDLDEADVPAPVLDVGPAVLVDRGHVEAVAGRDHLDLVG